MPGIFDIAWLVLMAVLGLVFGSFGNVVVWRLPRGESLSEPPSHCPKCGHAVRWRDNVPVLSWLLLRGRCRDCGEPISVRYPLVEAGSALLWLASGVVFGISVRALACAVLLYLLLLLSLIDVEVLRLPNVLVATLAGLGAAFAVAYQVTGAPSVPLLQGDAAWLGGPVASAAMGAALGAGVSGLVAAVYGLVRRRSGLGMGDVKLLAAIGVFTGPWVLMVYVLGNILGAAGVLLSLIGARGSEQAGADAGESSAALAVDTGSAAPAMRPEGPATDEATTGGEGPATVPAPPEGFSTRRIPFGPYLAAATLVTVFAGPAIWTWYLSLIGL